MKIEREFFLENKIGNHRFVCDEVEYFNVIDCEIGESGYLTHCYNEVKTSEAGEFILSRKEYGKTILLILDSSEIDLKSIKCDYRIVDKNKIKYNAKSGEKVTCGEFGGIRSECGNHFKSGTYYLLLGVK